MANDRDHAIVVGITKYPGISDLAGPCRDAEAFIRWLESPDGGDVPTANIRKVLTAHAPADEVGIADARPGRDDIEQPFLDLVPRVQEAPHIGRRLYVFMAGHGLGDMNDTSKVGLYAANATQHGPYNVQVPQYVDWLKRMAGFEELVLIMDACRTNNPMHTVASPSVPVVLGRSHLANKVKMFRGYATGWGSVARERDFNGEVWGLFSKALLDALENARPDRDGNVTGVAVKERIHNAFGELVGAEGEEGPEIQADTQSDIVWFKREARTKTLTIKMEPFNKGAVIRLEDGTFTLVETRPAQAAEEAFALPPGIYKVSIQGTSRKTLVDLSHDTHEQL